MTIETTHAFHETSTLSVLKFIFFMQIGVHAFCKIVGAPAPPSSRLETVSGKCFDVADMNSDSKVTKDEFEHWVVCTPDVLKVVFKFGTAGQSEFEEEGSKYSQMQEAYREMKLEEKEQKKAKLMKNNTSLVNRGRSDGKRHGKKMDGKRSEDNGGQRRGSGVSQISDLEAERPPDYNYVRKKKTKVKIDNIVAARKAFNDIDKDGSGEIGIEVSKLLKCRTRLWIAVAKRLPLVTPSQSRTSFVLSPIYS